MIRSLLVGAALALAASSSASAAMLVAPVADANPAIVRVADGCGPGFFRGPGGYCRRMHGEYMPPVYRPYRPFMCPPGMHPGRYDRRCFPNR